MPGGDQGQEQPKPPKYHYATYEKVLKPLLGIEKKQEDISPKEVLAKLNEKFKPADLKAEGELPSFLEAQQLAMKAMVEAIKAETTGPSITEIIDQASPWLPEDFTGIITADQLTQDIEVRRQKLHEAVDQAKTEK